MPSSREDTELITGARALITSLIFFVTGVPPSRSVAIFSALTFIENVPAAVGVPLNKPVELFRLNPLGWPDMLKVTGEVPENFIVAEYSVPMTPAVRLDVVIFGFVGFALIVKVTVPLTCPLGVVAVKVTE